jgi:hypothetical protein
MKGIVLVLMLSCIASLNANPCPVVNITGVSQRDDASRKVDIYYNISHTMPVTITLKVSDDNGSTWTLPCTLVTGDIGESISPGNGKHIVWDVLAEHPDVIYDYLFKVLANDHVHTIPTEGLVAYYPFNGNANDEGGNENHGVVYGATLTENRFGNPASAYSFDGNDYINIGQLPQLNNANGITVSCWIFKTSSNRVEGFVGKWRSSQFSDNVFLLYNGEQSYLNNGSFVVQTQTSSQLNHPWATGVGSVQEHSWVHITGVWSNIDGQSALFKNGMAESYSVQESSINQLLNTNTAFPAVIGNWGNQWGSNYYMRGKIDDVRIFNRALTEEEIQALYHEGGWGL